jgi:serine/threonine protein kinase
MAPITDELPELSGYDLVDELGRGGMGVVYEAFQRSTGRRVAVKFMLDRVASKEDARRRFEREVELVARLQHPHIVSVLDSGISRGSYFYVLEFIEGVPLDQYFCCGECDVRHALGMIILIAEAVDYAHQRGVLHRDLKPSNILVDKNGDPHVFDFGLAKAIDPVDESGSTMAFGHAPELTISRPGQVIGTLGYMSPEQSRGEYDHMSLRSDVYSLGAIAYELLTGQLPCSLNGPLAEILSAIAQRDPARPSSLRPVLKRGGGDIDAILLKALEKDPLRRYATAGEFADDIKRALNNQPIRARPPSPWLRTMKFVRRNRAASAVTALATLTILTMASLWVIDKVRALDVQRALNELSQETFLSVDAQTGLGPMANTRQLVDRFAERIDSSRLKDYPKEEAALRTTIGELYLGWLLWDKAREQFELALEQRRALFGPEHELVAESLQNLARPYFYLRNYNRSAELYQQALAMRTKLLGPQSKEVADTMHQLASAYRAMEKFEDSELLFRKALAIRETHPDDPVSIAATRNNLALLMLKTGRAAEAEPLFLDALATLESLPEAKRKRVFEAYTLQSLGECYMDLGRLNQAQQRLLDALERKKQLLGEDSPTVAQTLHSLAELRLKQGTLDEAMKYASEALEIRRAQRDAEATRATEELLAQIDQLLRSASPPPTRDE